MSTWHQDKGGMLQPVQPEEGYVIVSEAQDVMQTKVKFGEERDYAFSFLEAYRKNQPHQTHLLYYRGRLIA